jgi:hypothetical protein
MDPKIKLRSEYVPGEVGQYIEGEAEGAYPNGTRIMKVDAEDSDSTPIGTGGYVLSSLATPPGFPQPDPAHHVAFFYFVKWDSFEQPVGIADWKIGKERTF